MHYNTVLSAVLSILSYCSHITLLYYMLAALLKFANIINFRRTANRQQRNLQTEDSITDAPRIPYGLSG